MKMAKNAGLDLETYEVYLVWKIEAMMSNYIDNDNYFPFPVLITCYKGGYPVHAKHKEDMTEK
jgi:hypothetical protein